MSSESSESLKPSSFTIPRKMNKEKEKQSKNQKEQIHQLQSRDTDIHYDMLLNERLTITAQVNKARNILYFSHVISQFAEVSWQFCLIIFLAAFTQFESFILVSTYGITAGIFACLLGSKTGRIIDNPNINRINLARFFIFSQNGCVVIASISCYLLLIRMSNIKAIPEERNWLYKMGEDRIYSNLILLILLHLMGAFARVLDEGFTVALEQDWIVVMSEMLIPTNNEIDCYENKNDEIDHNDSDIGQRDIDNNNSLSDYKSVDNDEFLHKEDDHVNLEKNKESLLSSSQHNQQGLNRKWLSQTNVVMKQIDLFCKILAPTISGFWLSSVMNEKDNGNNGNDNEPGKENSNVLASSEGIQKNNLADVALIIGVLNVLSLIVELYCSKAIYDTVPSLREKIKVDVNDLNENVVELNNIPVNVKSCTASTMAVDGDNIEITQKDKNHIQDISESQSINHIIPQIKDNSQQVVETNLSFLHCYSCCCDNSRYTEIPDFSNNDENGEAMSERGKQKIEEKKRNRCCTLQVNKSGVTKMLPDSLQIYLDQPVCFGGIALALLYMNVLTFGAMMTAYLVWRGMSFNTIGIWRGVSSTIGLCGTLAFHYSMKRLKSLAVTGMWSIVLQFMSLSISFASFFMSNDTLSTAMFITGVCMSRVGLWAFDITITQLMQQFVHSNVRGRVGGVQKSLHAFFELTSYFLALIFHETKDFFILVIAGYVSVCIAMLCFMFGIYFNKGISRLGSEV